MVKTQYKTSIALDRDTLDKARELKINISRACNQGLKKEINDYQKYLESKAKAEA